MSNLSSIYVLSTDTDTQLFRIDKEAMVIDLYKQRKTRRQIASIVRMNFSDIKTIIDREFGSKDEKKTAKNTDSVYSQALKLFIKGRKQMEVAIILNLSYEETRRIYLQFLKLNRMHRLGKVYDELGDDLGEDGIKPFVLLYDRMKESNFTLEQITEAVNFAGSLDDLEQKYYTLTQSNDSKLSEKRKLATSTYMLRNQIDEVKRELEYYNYQCEMKKKELSTLVSEVNIKKDFIQSFDNEDGLIRIKESAKNPHAQKNIISQAPLKIP